MAIFSVEIVTPDLPSEGFFSRIWSIVSRRKANAERKIKKMLESYARHGHRSGSGRHYEYQTGQLAKATKVEGNLEQEIRLYVDESQAPYAGWILTGERRNPKGGAKIRWNGGKGDPFIQETIEAKQDEINQIIENLYDESVAEWNESDYSAL